MESKNIVDRTKEEKEVIEGKETKDKVYSSENAFEDEASARKEYTRAIDKLYNVNLWSHLPGISSTFQLYNQQGDELNETRVKKGNYIKINLPGPFPENWVHVTDIKETDSSAEFTVNPSQEPKAKENNTKHFFVKEARSTFKVELRNNVLFAFEIGMNEGINNQEEEAGNRELINTLIAEGGWAGFQKFQWKKLTDYLVHKTEIEE